MRHKLPIGIGRRSSWNEAAPRCAEKYRAFRRANPPLVGVEFSAHKHRLERFDTAVSA